MRAHRRRAAAFHSLPPLLLLAAEQATGLRSGSARACPFLHSSTSSWKARCEAGPSSRSGVQASRRQIRWLRWPQPAPAPTPGGGRRLEARSRGARDIDGGDCLGARGRA